MCVGVGVEDQACARVMFCTFCSSITDQEMQERQNLCIYIKIVCVPMLLYSINIFLPLKRLNICPLHTSHVARTHWMS